MNNDLFNYLVMWWLYHIADSHTEASCYEAAMKLYDKLPLDVWAQFPPESSRIDFKDRPVEDYCQAFCLDKGQFQAKLREYEELMALEA